MFAWFPASTGVQEPKLRRAVGWTTEKPLQDSFGGENWDYKSDKILDIFS